LKQIQSEAFTGVPIVSVLLPSHVSFIAENAFPAVCSISHYDNSCPRFREWLSLREKGSSTDFEREQEFESTSRTDLVCIVDLPSFELVKIFRSNPRVPVHLLANSVMGCQIALKCHLVLSPDQQEIFQHEIDVLIKLKHRCIVSFFSSIPQIQPNGPRAATHFMTNRALKKVVTSPPVWWTGTAKSIAVAGIVSGMELGGRNASPCWKKEMQVLCWKEAVRVLC
jgi:hypothetical protein